jgi:uncharacterized protein (TIGR03435 family)
MRTSLPVLCALTARVLLNELPLPAQVASPVFEVAAVKPSNPTPGPNDRRALRSGGRYTAIGFTLSMLISLAYGVQRYEISGPAWIYSDRYDIVAKMEPKTNNDQLTLMLRQLLAERFKLTLHHETKELPVYALIIGKNGSKLTKSAAETPYSRKIGDGRLICSGCPLTNFRTWLTNLLGRTVVDLTGLTGKYDFQLEFTPDQRPTIQPDGTVAAAQLSGGPSIFTALQEQLGLKLESRKHPVDMLILDHADHPSEN